MKTCPNCNEIVPRGHGLKRSRQYCSYKCYLDKTPKMVEVERGMGMSIRDAILNTLNTTGGIKEAAELLGINRQQLYKWMEKLEINRVLYYE